MARRRALACRLSARSVLRALTAPLPCPVALASTWDERLVHDVALALGHEARGKGIDVILGPTVNIVRTPLWGRNFETYSEDPFLAGRLGAAYVEGLQGEGVGAHRRWR